MNEEWELTETEIEDTAVAGYLEYIKHSALYPPMGQQTFIQWWVATAAQRKLVGWLSKHEKWDDEYSRWILVDIDWQAMLSALSPQPAGQFTGHIDEVRVLGPMTAEQVNNRLAAHEAMEQPHEEGG